MLDVRTIISKIAPCIGHGSIGADKKLGRPSTIHTATYPGRSNSKTTTQNPDLGYISQPCVNIGSIWVSHYDTAPKRLYCSASNTVSKASSSNASTLLSDLHPKLQRPISTLPLRNLFTASKETTTIERMAMPVNHISTCPQSQRIYAGTVAIPKTAGESRHNEPSSLHD